MRLIYEKDGKFYRSESGIPEKDGIEVGLTREQVEGYALVYAKDGIIRASVSGIPSEDDVILYPVSADEPEANNEEEPGEETGEDEPAANEESGTEDDTE